MGRLEAARKGDTHYRGKPCKAGHDGLRYTSNGVCVACTLAYGKTKNQRVRELLKAARAVEEDE